MSSSEEDYMSDAFLNGAAKQDIRPGLIHSHTKKREHELWKSKADVKRKRKPTSTLEKEARSDGLQEPISSDNKGFALLTKMGFNPGCGLGKYGQGRTEPIDINVKNDKQGLGRKAAVQEIVERKRKILENRKKTPSVEDYRASLSEKANERQTLVDLLKSQRMCYTLDKDWGVEKPDEVWFWPAFAQEPSEEDNEEECDNDEIELSPREKLELLTVYLRRTHLYCTWCSVKYEDEDDMLGCPGPTRYDHDE